MTEIADDFLLQSRVSPSLVVSMSDATEFSLQPVAGALGAEIRGIDLAQALSEQQCKQLHAAFTEYLVLFFPEQELSPADQIRFAQLFGPVVPTRFEPPMNAPLVDGYPEIYVVGKAAESDDANIGGFWHADVTHREKPNLASIGYMIEAPDVGGDTLYANQYLAYEALSTGMKRMLEDMNAVHSSRMPHVGATRSPALARERAPKPGHADLSVQNLEKEVVETLHPVVRRHPESGRKSLYVNRGFTSRFEDMTEAESLPLLEFLWEHAARPEFTCRYRLAKNAVVIWDNRCLLHYALNDYFGQDRVLHRVSVAEPERPSR